MAKITRFLNNNTYTALEVNRISVNAKMKHKNNNNNLYNAIHCTGKTILTLEYQVTGTSSSEQYQKFSAHAMVPEQDEKDPCEQLSHSTHTKKHKLPLAKL